MYKWHFDKPNRELLKTHLAAISKICKLHIQISNIPMCVDPRGGTQKAFKSLDESPGSNEPGFLVRDLWYSWLISGKSRTSVYFHQSQSRKKELGLLKKTIPVAGFLLGFVSETQIMHFSFILLFSKCPFSKGSFCIKSICKNYFLYLFHTNMYAIHTFSWR